MAISKINLKYLIYPLLFTISTLCSADDVEFSHERGYYENSFSLELDSDISGATIRYALNGAALSTSAGQIYATPITISTNTSIRAIAYNSTDTSVVFSHTYIFINDVITQADNINNFPTGTGIDNSIQNDAQYGPQLDDALTSIPAMFFSLQQSDYNYIYGTKGDLRAANIEFFDQTTGESYGRPSGVQTYGNTSFSASDANKKNYRFKFQEEFGAKKFKHPIFGKEAVDEFDVLDLRAGSQSTIDRGGVQNMHEKFLKDLQIQMSEYGVHGRFVHVYINAVYWGVYTLSERPEKAFGESYFSGKKEDYNTIKATCCNTNALAIDGTTTSYNYMKSQAGNYPAIEQYLDIDHFIDWVMLCNYGPHGDWRTWNTYAIDNPVAGEPYRFFMWDPEPSLYNDWYYTDVIVGTRDHNDIWNPLAANADFRMRVADHFECNCIEPDGPLNPVNVENYYTEIFDTHSLAYMTECGRWADKDLYDDFLQYRDDLVSSGWFYNRMDDMKAAYEDENLYPSIDAVQFSQPSSAVSAGTQITLSNPNSNGTIYYTTDGSDPRNPGGGISGSAQSYSGAISLSQGVIEIKARVRINSSTWSAMCPKRYYVDQDYSSLVINEIMYHPDDTCSANPDEMDYIEIFNAGSTTVNLTDTKFACGFDYTFSIGTTIAPGDYLVLAENTDTFNLHYGFMPDGQFSGGLSNDGEEIIWQDFEGNIIDQVTYNDKNPWDEMPDGKGPSLELLDPTLDNADPINWFRSDNLCGTPGQANSRTCANAATPIIINEINYNPATAPNAGDWVELYNPNSTAVDISDWEFYDNENQYIIPTGTIIQPDEYLILAEDVAVFGGYFTNLNAGDYIGDWNFNLSNGGERISLFDDNKCLSDYVVYNDKQPWDTTPDGNGPSLSLIDPALDNALPQSWESSSNINSAFGTPGRANVPCPGGTIVANANACPGIPALITVDVPDNAVSYSWFFNGGSPGFSTSPSEMVTWNNSGTYLIQLITAFEECVTVQFFNIEVDCVVSDVFTMDEDTNLNNTVTTATTPVSLVTDASNGTLNLNPDGTFDYTPDPDFTGIDLFTYETCQTITVYDTTYTGSPGSYSGKVNSGEDDAEERNDGTVYNTSNDLELLDDPGQGGLQNAVGIRFENVNIPQGATITNAYLRFTANNSDSGASTMVISAEDTGNAPAFTTNNFSLSNKATVSPYTWSNVGAWTNDQVYDTPDIKTVVQQIIDRGDWSGGNAINFIFTGTGKREAEAYDGVSSQSPELYIDYTTETIVITPTNEIVCEEFAVSINVLPINDAPVANDDLATTTEDTSHTDDLSVNDTDIDGDNLSINTTPVATPANGAVTLNVNGTYTYTPNPNFNGTDDFQYEICDNGTPQMCDVATVTLTITSENDAPTANDDLTTTPEDIPVSDDLTVNDIDIDGDNVTIDTNPVSPPANGSVIINLNGTFTYTPNPDFYGTDSFTYEICDGVINQIITPGSFSGEVISSADDVEELVSGEIEVTSSDLDMMKDGADIYTAIGIRIVDITVPQGATVTGAYLEFVADETQSVASSFSINAEATGHALPLDTVAYSISSKPRTNATASWANVPAWTTGNVYPSTDISPVIQEIINRGDWVSGNAMTFIIEGAERRTAESFDGTAAPKLFINYETTTQSMGASLCDTAIVTIDILPENDAPQAVNDIITTSEDVVQTGNILNNDVNIDGDNLAVNTNPIMPPQNGTLTLLADGSYSYTPNIDFYGTDTFEYEICDDGSPVLCDTASVTIDVTSVNDAPTPASDTLYMLANSTIQDNVLLNDSDIENDNLTAMTSPMATPINGTVVIQSNGNIDYTPNPNFVGTDSFTYEVCDDGTPTMCDTETVTILIEPDCVDIELATWLEGAYQPALGEMRTTLVATRKLLPGQTPASNLATPTPAGQPYSAAPWNYTGTEGISWTDADYTGDETDWVLVSFRTDIQKNTEVGMTAALLMKDGSITFPDRCALTSTVMSPLYILVEHRNHVGVMTPQPVDVIGSTLTYDFRSSDSYRDPTSFGQKQLPTGEWTMYAGDANQLDFPSYDIQGTDKTIWFDNNGVFDYYFAPDFNLDGDINGQDKSLWFDNNGISSRVPK